MWRFSPELMDFSWQRSTGGTGMRQIAFLLIAVAVVVGAVASMIPSSGHAAGEADPIFVTTTPPEYRDWKWIASAHEAGDLNNFGGILGNDIAIRAYREKTLPFPDGSIIAALHYHFVPLAFSWHGKQLFMNAASPGLPSLK